MNAVESFWLRYLTTQHMPLDSKYLEAFHFELTKKSANELLKLVLEGKKRATASSLEAYRKENEKLPIPGDYSIVTDFDGNPYAVIRTTAVTILPYRFMTFDICKREGEDDTLESWKKNHKKFFTEEGKMIGYKFNDSMLVVFEDFELLYQEEFHEED